jgi:hypothetical protein
MFYLTDDKEIVAYFNTWFQSDLIFPFLFLFINFDVWSMNDIGLFLAHCTAPVFSLPRYSVSIPDYSSIDSSVIAFYFTDSDYSDFYVDYQPEYDYDAYFYLDTKKTQK